MSHLIESHREVGGWGRVPFSRNLMKPTPRRKWYLTTGRRFHEMVLDPIPQCLPVHIFGSRPQPPPLISSKYFWLPPATLLVTDREREREREGERKRARARARERKFTLEWCCVLQCREREKTHLALHYTATHCNTLQHTATHCNILQHTATHCNTLQHTATHCTREKTHLEGCSVLQCSVRENSSGTATHCNTLQHTAPHAHTHTHTHTHCNTLQHNATQYS